MALYYLYTIRKGWMDCKKKPRKNFERLQGGRCIAHLRDASDARQLQPEKVFLELLKHGDVVGLHGVFFLSLFVMHLVQDSYPQNLSPPTGIFTTYFVERVGKAKIDYCVKPLSKPLVFGCRVALVLLSVRLPYP